VGQAAGGGDPDHDDGEDDDHHGEGLTLGPSGDGASAAAG
jgi:hypothetical protein